MAARGTVRFYEKEMPDEEEVVMCRVVRLDRGGGDAKAGLGAYVELLEYGNMMGLVLMSELSRRRIRSINKIIRVGEVTAVRVIRVSSERGFVDLSKRRVHPSEAAAHQEKYQKSVRVDSFLRRVATTLENRGKHVSLESLYETVAWPLYKLKKSEEDTAPWFPHALDALEASARSPEILDHLPRIDAEVREELVAMLQRRLKSQPMRIRADVEVTCFTYDGVEAVRAALLEGEESTRHLPTSAHVRLISAPLYMVQAETITRQEGFDAVLQAVAAIGASIERRGGRMRVVAEARVAQFDDEGAKPEADAEDEEGDDEPAPVAKD